MIDVAVTSEERDKAKRVTYGIIYGLSAWGLAKGPAGLGIQVGQAQNLITSFLNHFYGVSCIHKHGGTASNKLPVCTLSVLMYDALPNDSALLRLML